MTATTTTTTSARTASGWSLALCATIALGVGAGVGSITTAALTDEGTAPTAQSSTVTGDLVSPDAVEHRIAAGGPTAVVAPPAAAGFYSADAAEHWLTADAGARLDVCTGAVVTADAIEHCLSRP